MIEVIGAWTKLVYMKKDGLLSKFSSIYEEYFDGLNNST